jgi:Ni,Fe-hydrogenase maturation factor
VPDTPASRLRRILREARRDGRRVLLFGIGNELRADDAVGFLIAQDLQFLTEEQALPPEGLFPLESESRFTAEPPRRGAIDPQNEGVGQSCLKLSSPSDLCLPQRLSVSAVNTPLESNWVSIPVGTALENAAGLVTKHAADVVFLVDAVRPPRRNARPWAFYEPDRLDAFIHSTHSIPMRLLVRWWQEERPGVAVHFLGIRIGDVTPFGEISPAVESARREIVGIFRSHSKSSPTR